MSNAERITGHNTRLRAAVDMAATLPDNEYGPAYTDAWITGSISGDIVNDRVTSVRIGAFAATKVTSVSFPNVVKIGEYAFYNNDSIVTADFPKATSMGDRAFYRCGKLENINIPLATEIGSYGVYVCPYVRKIVLQNVKTINGYGFSGCSRLATLVLGSDTVATLAATSALNNTPIKSGTGYVYVPAALVEEYKAATNWATFADQIRAIEDYPDIVGG